MIKNNLLDTRFTSPALPTSSTLPTLPTLPRLTTLTVFLVCLFMAAPVLWGHGLKVTVIKKSPCVIVNAQYHGASGLAFAEISILFEGEENPFQKGEMDKYGNFCFYPDQKGKWLVKVDDGMGHIKGQEIVIEGDFFQSVTPTSPEKETAKRAVPESGEEAPAQQPAAEKVSSKPTHQPAKPPVSESDFCCYMLKIVLGLGLIFGITLLLKKFKK